MFNNCFEDFGRIGYIMNRYHPNYGDDLLIICAWCECPIHDHIYFDEGGDILCKKCREEYRDEY